MLGYLIHSNIMVEVSLNPLTWYMLPKFERKHSTPAFPRYAGMNVSWLFIRIYTYVDDGTIDVQAMYEQQEREQSFVGEY